MKPAYLGLVGSLFVFAVYASTTTAGAQDAVLDELDTLRDTLGGEDYEMEIDDWTITPQGHVSAGWSDNIIEDAEKRSDGYFGSGAGVDIERRFGKVDYFLSLDTDLLRPLTVREEDELELSASTGVAVDIGEKAQAGVELNYQSIEIGATTQDYDREQNAELRAKLEVAIGKARLELRGTASRTFFSSFIDDEDDVEVDPGNNSGGSLIGAIFWEIRPDVELLAGATGRYTTFDVADDDDLRRGGIGYGVFAGVQGSAKEKLRGGLVVGVGRQDFSDGAFAELLFATVNGNLQWRPIEKFALTVRGATDFKDGSDYFAAGALTYRAGLQAEKQVGERFLISAGADHTYTQFVAADVRENTTDLHAGIAYSLAKHTVASLDFRHRIRSSDDPDENFNENRIMTRIRFN